MKMFEAYIDGMAQITPQLPLCDDWLESPLAYGYGLHPAVDPSYAGLVPAAAARRMSLLQKRAVATCIKALSSACLDMPDAIVTSTGAGTMANSERFLLDMIESNEEGLQPTPFINSTHNTLAATVAITLGCKGYNTTYSHNSMSFPSALLDAMLGLGQGIFGSVLLSANDELPEHYYRLLEEAGEFEGEPFAGEHSLSFVLRAAKGEHSLAAVTMAEVVSSSMLGEAASRALEDGPGLIVTGDAAESRSVLGENVPMYAYKEVFGGGFSSPAAGFYAAVALLRKTPGLHSVLVHDHYRHRQHSFIIIKEK